MRQLAQCVGLLCLVTGVMEVKVRVTVQELASRRGRQLAFNVDFDERVFPVFAASVATATLQNIINEVFASGRCIL